MPQLDMAEEGRGFNANTLRTLLPEEYLGESEAGDGDQCRPKSQPNIADKENKMNEHTAVCTSQTWQKKGEGCTHTVRMKKRRQYTGESGVVPLYIVVVCGLCAGL